ncbi:von Willebrand factor A domain-containing protein 8 [Schistocerca nitens]|uniref:von Willebrand factor A domain-containing protein 8 n=1 Tax=Schistocerca nitens TaxID=7011 RepID=UPI002117C072|nr:von Willebrand factor A domain-containing protein 8 [Schistocerca nitens]
MSILRYATWNRCKLGPTLKEMGRSTRIFASSPAQRRIGVLCRILSPPHPNNVSASNLRRNSSSDVAHIKIGNVSKPLRPAKLKQYVPVKYLEENVPQDMLAHLRWMLQKDLLGQDIFLIGRPGPLRRQLAMRYLEMTSRELEYVALSRDTTEADLKQRREIRSGTAHYFDQSAVRAAIKGRILVLEGIEKAERNVLPVLNNLLENREMHLEDGRFLIPADRYDKLLKEHSQEELDRWQLVRVSEDFRVVALGLPVPRYVGNPLDPPLRSRFQARDIGNRSFKEQLEHLRSLTSNVDPAQISQLLSCCHALLSQESASLGLPDFPADNLPVAVRLQDTFPTMAASEVLYRLYPYKSFLPAEGVSAVEDVLQTFQMLQQKTVPLTVETVTPTDGDSAHIRLAGGYHTTDVEVVHGNGNNVPMAASFIPTPYQEQLVAQLLQSHFASDLCLVGPRGCGKTATVSRLAGLLRYHVEPIALYQDMTSRDLIQQRTTLPNGDTVWQNSPLVTAALEGKLAILDGIHRIHPSTLAIVHRLVHDRELTLHDGQRLVRHDRYDEYKKRYGLTDRDLQESGVLRIHPAFRIVGLAEPPAVGSQGRNQWLSSELLSLFLFHEMRPLSLEEELQIISHLYGTQQARLMSSIVDFAHKLRSSTDPTLRSLANSLSTRQLLRIARRLSQYPMDSQRESIHRACLSRFLPPLARQILDTALTENGFPIEQAEMEESAIKCDVDENVVQIGQTVAPRYKTAAKTKIPDITFFNIPQHLSVLEWMLQDFMLGEHLLLVGNQGVGKNKLADRLLQLLGRPREYIQLHRDTTVQTLTLQPTVRDGVVIYEDSPLVQAVKSGHVLVVDEADKAPTHVTCILKTLVESGEMILSDGRRIVPHGDPRVQSAGGSVIALHPDFRMIVLANRPGFPFLGNDFFGALGDLFSCHAVDNPSPQSERALLKQYGPDVPDAVINRLVKAFGELRSMADQGLVQYPYSTREVVNIVKHLQVFPHEGLVSVVRNVFDFDSYSPEAQETVIQILQKHGIPMGASPSDIRLAREFPMLAPQLTGEWRLLSSVGRQVSVEEHFVKTGRPSRVATRTYPLDVVQARGAVFAELQSYWALPLEETSIVAGLTVTKDSSDNMMHDHIHALLSNPLRLMTMQPTGSTISEVPLQGTITPVRGARPQYTLAPLCTTGNYVLVHEQSSNGLVLVDWSAGEIHKVPLSGSPGDRGGAGGFFGLASSSVGNWKMLPALLHDMHTAVFYEEGGERAEVVNFQTFMRYNITFPMNVISIHIPSPNHWLIECEDRRYVLTSSSPSDPCPSLLSEIQETGSANVYTAACGYKTVPSNILSQALGQSLSVPSRLLAQSGSAVTLAVGFPDLSQQELYTWQSSNSRSTRRLGHPLIFSEHGQVIRNIPASQAPEDLADPKKSVPGATGFLEVTDIVSRKQRYIPIPQAVTVSPLMAWLYASNELPVYIAATSESGVATLDAGGCIRLWETSLVILAKSSAAWKEMIGPGREHLQMTVDRPSNKDVTAPKHGKVDETGAPHVGGNTWAGGTGGRDTAGLGGKGGPYRLDAGHDVHQVSQEEKDAVPEEVKKAAREMAQKAFKQRLKEIQMSDYDAKLYGQFSEAIAPQVRRLRVILSSLQAKSKERQWLRHQTAGELDDSKLIEGLTGEKTIFRRRAEKEPELGTPQLKPKRLKFVVDVSGSMYRFNGYDGRLDREMEAAVMVMEAFEGHESQIQYDIVGHSGEDAEIMFVNHKSPPTDNKKRLDVVKTMHAHAQFCMSGDNTLEATKQAIDSLAKEDCDEAIVVLLSDANLERYGIPPQRFAAALTSNADVNAYAIFIGSLGDQAERLVKQLPSGRAFVCLDLKNIPQILQQIFASSLLSGR